MRDFFQLSDVIFYILALVIAAMFLVIPYIGVLGAICFTLLKELVQAIFGPEHERRMRYTPKEGVLNNRERIERIASRDPKIKPRMRDGVSVLATPGKKQGRGQGGRSDHEGHATLCEPGA